MAYRRPDLNSNGLRSAPIFFESFFFLCTLADFRPGSPFSAFYTEVYRPVSLLTSVPEAPFRSLGRKYTTQYAC